jgi:hypothetical protein
LYNEELRMSTNSKKLDGKATLVAAGSHGIGVVSLLLLVIG